MVKKGAVLIVHDGARARRDQCTVAGRAGLSDEVFAKNELEYGRERTGARASAARGGGSAYCRPDGLESNAVRI